MTDCDICKIMEKKEDFLVVYEDEKVIALLHESPAVLGHTLVIPKQHFPIFEEVPDDIIEHSFTLANTISTAIFDSIGALGTNILVNNGLSANQEHAHFLINVIPRKEEDKINFEWEPKKTSDEALKTTQSMIKTFVDAMFDGKSLDVSNVKVKEDKIVRKEEDYQVKQLRRVP
ncbi:HIT family protein [Candidatus Woesearchaeota archaeon]|nr:HIT family protein [Candidatus Woesearchaeota archaeon]